MGNLHPLHVRVDIDEHDAPRFRPGAAARASLRGTPEVSYPLQFVRVEPYVVPKKSLTGDNTERVDTRVLQVIYDLDVKDRPIYVGQQMDVFIDAGDSGRGGNAGRLSGGGRHAHGGSGGRTDHYRRRGAGGRRCRPCCWPSCCRRPVEEEADDSLPEEARGRRSRR